MAEATLKADDMMKSITVRVRITGVNRALFRVRLAMRIIRFAIWVGGFGGVRFTGDD